MLAMAGVAEILVGCCLWRTGAVVNGLGGGIAWRLNHGWQRVAQLICRIKFSVYYMLLIVLKRKYFSRWGVLVVFGRSGVH